MCFTVIKSKVTLKDGKKLRGISRNKTCVVVGIDDNNIYIKVEPTSKPSKKSTWDALGNVIDPGSHLIHDEEKSHGILIEKLKLTSTTHSS